MKNKTLIILASLLLALTSYAVPTTNNTASVTLAWDASLGTNVIANYNIYYGSVSGIYTNTVSAKTNLTYTINNLSLGQTYYFAATAVDVSGLESDYSNEISYTVSNKPLPPVNFRVIVNVVVDVNVNK